MITPTDQVNTKRVAVTGAGGFIGRHLCAHLELQGHAVTAIVRRSGPRGCGRTEQVVPDLTDIVQDTPLFDGCDVVVHLAGRAHILNDGAGDPAAEFRRVNVDVTRKLMLNAALSGVKRFVFVSSIGVNGNSTGSRPFVEGDDAQPHDAYAVSKYEAEQLVRALAASCGMEFVIVRPTLVFGAEAPGNFALLLKLAAKGWPLPFGALTARRNVLSIGNFVSFLQLCISHPAAAGEIFLIADEQRVSLVDIFGRLGAGMARPQTFLSVPETVLRCAAFLLGKSRMFAKLNGQLLVDASKARTVLGWRAPYSSVDALERAGREYKLRKQK